METNDVNPAHFSYGFKDITDDPVYKDLIQKLNTSDASLNDVNITNENDYYSRLGELYRSASEETKDKLITDVIEYIKTIDGPKSEYILNRQLCHWFRTDITLGIAIAKGLDLDLSETMKQMQF